MEIENKPYSEWLEDALTALFAIDPVNIGLVARTADGNTMTAYYNCDAEDMTLMAHSIQADVMLEMIRANAGAIKRMLNDG